ncbi:hypothetical protein, partial [Bacillus cereus]|uniref:hypothetical protein n=1 Tax=Bacillus cereus TaxID=1396 RepID=UPI0019D5557C
FYYCLLDREMTKINYDLHAFYFDSIVFTRRISEYKKNYGSIYVVATCTRRGNNPNVFILKIGSSK